MSIKPIYTAIATATGGRNGHVESSDGILNLEVRMPKEFGTPGGAYTNPEQLFAAGYAACFGSAVARVIQTGKLHAGAQTVRAHVAIGANENGVGFGLAVVLEVNIADVDEETAKSIAEQAHQICPYSNATRGNIEVELKTTNLSADEFAAVA
jgi:osmotically inducible protein OsmC